MRNPSQRTLLETSHARPEPRKARAITRGPQGHHRDRNHAGIRTIIVQSERLSEAPDGPTRATLPRAATRHDKAQTPDTSNETRARAGRSAFTKACKPTPPPADHTASQLPRPTHCAAASTTRNPTPSAVAVAARRRRRRRRRRKNACAARLRARPAAPSTCAHTVFNITTQTHQLQQQRIDRRARSGGWYC